MKTASQQNQSNTHATTGQKKVFVGLSGGVDSAVSAAILKDGGYDVTGVYIKVWQPDWIECNWKEERRDAMRVAAHLSIPFITFDAIDEYKKGVIDYMISEYTAGRTPNPDVMCNREVKFGAFRKWALANGADMIATGHYARIFKDAESSTYKLLKGIDTNKDQSYFLWTLTQEDLSKTLFPVGNMRKDEVREMARKYGLPNSEKKDSQGLCFIGKVDIKEFLRHYISKDNPHMHKGDVLDIKGNIIGRHPGSLLLTIGERHGFEITKKTPNDRPYYVVSKDLENNTITVDNSDNKKISGSDDINLSRCNWINNISKVQEASEASRLDVRTRYRQNLAKAEILSRPSEDRAILSIGSSAERVASGQSLVAYDGDICLGGGIIE